MFLFCCCLGYPYGWFLGWLDRTCDRRICKRVHTYCNLKSSAGACLIGFDLTDGNIGQHACSGGVVFPTPRGPSGEEGVLENLAPGRQLEVGNAPRTADDERRTMGKIRSLQVCGFIFKGLVGRWRGGDLRLAGGNRCSRSLQLSPSSLSQSSILHRFLPR